MANYRELEGIIMQKVIFYMRKPCPLCDDVKTWLLMLQQEYAFEIEERSTDTNIATNDTWLEKYQLQIPVVTINDVMLHANQLNVLSLERVLKQETRRKDGYIC